MMRIATYILLAIMAFLSSASMAEEREAMPFVVMEYNCENLYDCRHDTLKEDRDFTPEGSMQWTFPRLWKKLNDIGRVVVAAGGDIDNRHLPDLVAMVEVENDTVMRLLTQASMLREVGYRYVMTESADVRGVDVALMYNPYTFRLLSHHAMRIEPGKGERPTRDVLYAKGLVRTGDTLHVMVVHAPSRRGGRKLSEPYRLRVAERVAACVDSLHAVDSEANIVVAGDFNDYFYDKSLRLLEKRGLTNVSAGVQGQFAKGTYKFQGEWGSLDHILLSAPLRQGLEDCRLLEMKWLLKPDKKGDYSPRRTFLGTAYQGGVSDHLPLVARVKMKNEKRKMQNEE